jgi:hypothetical protein
MRSAALLLALLLGARAAAPDKFQEFSAIPDTQIEQPPAEESEEAEVEVEVEEQDGWDVDYTVNRPTSSPDEVDEDECVRNYEGEGEGDKDCVVEGTDLSPYKKYKAYAKWQRRPLFVIIIGG